VVCEAFQREGLIPHWFSPVIVDSEDLRVAHRHPVIEAVGTIQGVQVQGDSIPMTAHEEHFACLLLHEVPEDADHTGLTLCTGLTVWKGKRSEERRVGKGWRRGW